MSRSLRCRVGDDGLQEPIEDRAEERPRRDADLVAQIVAVDGQVSDRERHAALQLGRDPLAELVHAAGVGRLATAQVVGLAQRQEARQRLATDLLDESPDGGIRPARLVAEHVPAHEIDDRLCLAARDGHPSEQVGRPSGADVIVPDEVPVRPGLGFAAVVEERRERQRLVPRRQPNRRIQGPEGVLPEVDARSLLLLHADLPSQEREERRQEAGLGQDAEAARRFGHGEHLAQLLPDPLGRDGRRMRSRRAQRGQRGRFDLEVELGRQADGPQQPQGVFVEPRRRIADGPDDPGRQVCPTARRIDEADARPQRHPDRRPGR